MHESHEAHLPPRGDWPALAGEAAGLAYPETLNLASELLDRHVREGRGGDPAIRGGGPPISYAALQRMTNRIGGVLRRAGVRPGDRVALRAPNRPVLAATWLAVQKIGAVGVGTMPMLRARELAYVVNDSGASAFVCAADLLDELVKARPAFDHDVAILAAHEGADAPDTPGVLSLDALAEQEADELEAYPTAKDDLAIIAYTSGSTGVPKGATHTPESILASADCYARHILSPSRGDVFGGHPTLAFTYGLGGLLVFPLRVGASTSLLDRYAPERLLQRIAEDRITILFCAATTYRMLLQDPQLETAHDLSSLRIAVSAGEPLPAAVGEEWMRRTGVPVLDGIGTTEMFYIFVSSRVDAVRPGSTGLPVPGYDVKVVGEDLQEVPRGTPGLIAVKGPTGCRYWNKPERQRAYVRQGWNLTGDVYVRDDDGYFWYQCRNDDLIICGGYNIAGPEVENVLIEHPAVLESAVVASPDAVRGFIPKAFVVLKPGQTPGPEVAAALQDHVRRELAPYKYPREIEFVQSLPRTETGKVRRVELRDLERQRKTTGA
ncbi:MAG TPA: benzoate-CoA ligase family protein [Vicinamibacterales bacterium]|jgi:2-aminobenzoate-CoA ligase|nr:benzoate-CoA ligase family protein [Vicinamibacterales bacterium]